MSKIAIDRNRCKKDGLCATVCPMGVLNHKEKGDYPLVVQEELCIACGHCLAVCPQGAIAHIDLPPGRIQPVIWEKLPSPAGFSHLLQVRRSIRAFKQIAVEKDEIAQVIDAARFAPSGHNTQSTEFIIIQDPALLKQVTQLTLQYFKKVCTLLGNPVLQPLAHWALGYRMENVDLLFPEFKSLIDAAKKGKDMILHSAPALIVFHARRKAVFAEVNAQLAAQNAALAAQSLGLGAFYTGYVMKACEDGSIARLLDIPGQNRIYAALAIGYPAIRITHWIEKEPAKIRWL
jgi:nitroreductase/NAD-dependent dihydropyrimidine dehydrogenase PreA subunit